MFRESLQTLAVIFSLVTSTVEACAKDIVRTVYYPVMGSSAREVYDYIRTQSPRVARNATFAFTLIANKTTKQEHLSAGSCRYTRFNTSALYSFYIPKHSRPAALPASTRIQWHSFVAHLKTHEAGHEKIWRKCFRDYDAASRKLVAKDCKTLDKAREKVLQQFKRDCLKQDEAFDVIFRRDVTSAPFVKAALAQKQ